MLAPGGRVALSLWGPPERTRWLGLVNEAVRVRGGSLVIGESPEGGALVLMRLPLGPVGQTPAMQLTTMTAG